MSRVLLGTVEAVQAFPVKSLQAGRLTAIELDAAGVVGDRRWAVVTEDGVLTADAAPQLREAVAVPGPGGEPILTLPVGVAGLSALVGRPARLEPVPAGSTLDAPV